MGLIYSFNKIYPKSNNIKFVLGIIDPQNDFFQSGSLEVSNSNEIIGPINKLRFLLMDKIDTFISMDTHPNNHISFASTHKKNVYDVIKIESKMKNKDIIATEQTLWPDHCVVNTFGQKIHSHIITTNNDLIIKKGTIQNVESYSAFGDETGNYYENTGLDDWLKNKNTTDIILVGLATDYCVYNTAMDGIKNGYKIHIILSCVRGVKKDTTISAIQDMKENGVIFYEDIDSFLFINSDIYK
jgi:nicotinamidase/pyrazinamidase